MKILYISAMTILLSSYPALACKADPDHNRKYHGNPKCLQCTCLHHHDDHNDNYPKETLISLGKEEVVTPVLPSVDTIATEDKAVRNDD